MSVFAPELQLDPTDRAHLVQIATSEGFRVLQRIMKAEVDKFVLAQINADPSNEAEVLAAHRMAKAAAQFYQGMTNRINEELLQFNHIARANDVPIDATEQLLDLGNLVEAVAQEESFEHS